MARRIGIYAGTFDPVHDGHLAFARAALQQAKLDQVVFLPERLPRYKPQVSPLEQRLAWLEQRIGTTKAMSVLCLDEPNFTVRRTLPELTDRFGQAELSLLLGSDVALHLERWPDTAKLLDAAALIVALRGDDTAVVVTAAMEHLQAQLGQTVRYSVLRADYSRLSSSQLRG